MRSQWADEELLAFLREHGKNMSLRDWRRAGYTPSAMTYVFRFGSWNAAREKAGLPTRPQHSGAPGPRWTQETIIAKLQEIGHYITKADWQVAHYRPAVGTIESRFSDYNSAWEAAGITPPPPTPHPYEVLLSHPRFAYLRPNEQFVIARRAEKATLTKIAEDLGLTRTRVHAIEQRALAVLDDPGDLRVVKEEGWDVTTIVAALQARGDVCDLDTWHAENRRPSVATIVAAFWSWERAWRAAGFMYPIKEPAKSQRSRGRTPVTGDEVCAAIRSSMIAHGHYMTAQEWYREGCIPSLPTIKRVYGSWDAACDAAFATMPVSVPTHV